MIVDPNPISYKSIEKVINDFDVSYDKKFVFRGQTNDFDEKTIEWDLTSSFKRYFSGNELSFNSFILNNLDRGLYDYYFSDYKYPNADLLSDAPFIEKLYYLQHYGIPTCLLDFSKDPIIALYFALSGIKINRVQSFNNNRCTTYGNDRYVTVYQIDTEKLIEIFKIEEIKNKNFCWNYDNFELKFDTQSCIKMAIDLNPLNIIDKKINYNLVKQKGCFILYDNTESIDNNSLIETLENINNDHPETRFEEPIITKHNFYLNDLVDQLGTKDIFSFVRKIKKVTGKTLFNDIQGLKFDLLQVHNDYN